MNRNYIALSESRDTMLKNENLVVHSYPPYFSKIKGLLSLLALFCIFFAGFTTNAQVNVTGQTNTTPAMSTSYGSLALAIADVNNRTAISGPVTISLTIPETSPAGGYVLNNVAITGGSNTNRFIFNGGANVITAPTPAGTVGALNDAIFKVIGADFITIQNFVMNENGANTTTAAGTNNMLEWGVALLYATTTDGAQNIVIQNNTITLNRIYQNTFGIYSNSTHSATTVTTAASATTTAGGSSGLKIYSNTISNVNNGIVVVGPTAIADVNTGVEIGGVGLGNSITNYGTTGTFSSYANVSGTVNGILIRNSNGFTVSNNTIASSVGGVTAGTLNGIQQAASSSAPTATFTNTINNNSISLRSGFITGAMNGITIPSGSASATSILNVNGNDFNTFGHTVAGTAAITFITNGSSHQTSSFSNNTFTNINVNTTGSVTFFVYAPTLTATGVMNINNNSIVTGFTKTGAGGTITIWASNASSVAGSVQTFIGNNFSNITLTGATTYVGYSNTDGPVGGGPTKTITGNTFSNITAGTNTFTGMTVGFSSAANVSSNTFNNISGGGTVTGMVITSVNQNVSQNTITGLSSTGASTVTGISNTAGTTNNIFKNTISNLSGSNASSSVNGITVSSGTTVTLSNNRIGDLRAPAAIAANPVNGINITGGTTVNAYFNTVYLTASSSGALFGSSAISASTTPTLTLNNNIFVNNSTANGAGLAVAYRRSSATLGTYGATSDRNDFFASTIYTDGTTPQVTIGAYKTLVGPTRDAISMSINPTFLSTVSGNVSFLKIDPTVATEVESAGVNIAGITDDFENEVRQGNPGYLTQVNGGGTAPDLGADEFDGMPAGGCTGTPAASNVNGVASICPGTGTTLSLSTIYTDLGITYAWFSGTTPGGPYPNALGTAATQATGNLSVDTYYIAVITCSNGGATATTPEKAVLMNALPAAVTALGGGTFCTSTTITASNGGDGTIYFQGTTSGGTSTATASTSQVITTSGTYYFRAQSALGCWGAEGSVTVAIQQPAGITGTDASVCQGGSGSVSATATNCFNYVNSGTSFSGAWTATSPSANRPNTSTNSTVCGFNANPRNYEAINFQVSVSGAYTFEMNDNAAYDGMGYLTSGAFVPGSCATGTFIKGDDDSGVLGDEPLLTANLVTGVTYTLVSTNWLTAVVVDSFNWTVTPPSGGQVMLPTPGTIEWYTAASGGSAIGTGSSFNPVGVAGSGLADTNTPGTTTYYAACASSSACRTAVNFLINPSSTNTTTAAACDTYTWSNNGQTYTTSGTYTGTTTSCVTEQLVLTITPSSTNTTTITACDTYTWTNNGQTYTTSGTYTGTTTSCVTEQLVLTITPSSSNTTTITACDTYTWSNNGQTYTTSGTYTGTTTSCVTQQLVLTINNSTTNGSMSASAFGSYTWAGPLGSGITYTTSGVYTNTTTNAAGCPNVATLTLTITPIVNSFVIGSSCGSMVSSLAVTIITPFVSGAPSYMFRVTNVATSASFVVTRPVNSFALSNYPGVLLGTQYQVEVSTNGGVTYGPACIVFTPAPTSTIGAQCGTTVANMSTFVYATYAASVTGYRFRVTNLTTSGVQVYDALSGQNRFNFNQLSPAIRAFGTTYSVEVALRNTDGTYLPYGTACNISTPAFPTSEIILSQCDSVATSNTQIFSAVVVSGATDYRFQLVNSGLGYSFSIDRPLNSFSLSLFPGLVAGTTYTVRVAVRIAGVWGPLTGKPCNITTPGAAPERAIVKNNNFAAITYPNPFAENFMFDVTTSAESTIQIRVYDMLGKQVENRNVEASEINNIQIGANYPSGVYNVIVSQGENSQTLRVIKR